MLWAEVEDEELNVPCTVEIRLRQMGIGCSRLNGGVPTAKCGAVLVNLDVPWNPAVLEQRNARIHRLGQTRTVQIITMIAADSCEEKVFALVRNKQHLFDNVIGEDASEDVIGVSRKLLKTLVEDLAGPSRPSLLSFLGNELTTKSNRLAKNGGGSYIGGMKSQADKVMGLKEAVALLVTDGCHLSIGGFTINRNPMAAIYEIIRQGKKDLHLYAHSNGQGVDELIGAGCVKRLEIAYAGSGRFAPTCIRFRRAVENGELSVEDYSNYHMTLRFLAGGHGFAFSPDPFGSGHRHSGPLGL